MNSNMTRRAVLASTPMVIAGASTAAALPEAENQDPHPALVKAFDRNFTALERAMRLYGDDSDEEKRLWAKYHRIEDLLCTPATTVEGLAAQLEFLVRENEEYWCCEKHGEMAEAAVEAAKRLAG